MFFIFYLSLHMQREKTKKYIFSFFANIYIYI